MLSPRRERHPRTESPASGRRSGTTVAIVCSLLAARIDAFFNDHLAWSDISDRLAEVQWHVAFGLLAGLWALTLWRDLSGPPPTTTALFRLRRQALARACLLVPIAALASWRLPGPLNVAIPVTWLFCSTAAAIVFGHALERHGEPADAIRDAFTFLQPTGSRHGRKIGLAVLLIALAALSTGGTAIIVATTQALHPDEHGKRPARVVDADTRDPSLEPTTTIGSSSAPPPNSVPLASEAEAVRDVETSYTG